MQEKSQRRALSARKVACMQYYIHVILPVKMLCAV